MKACDFVLHADFLPTADGHKQGNLSSSSCSYDLAVVELRIDADGATLAGSYSPAGETVLVALQGAAVVG